MKMLSKHPKFSRRLRRRGLKQGATYYLGGGGHIIWNTTDVEIRMKAGSKSMLVDFASEKVQRHHLDTL